MPGIQFNVSGREMHSYGISVKRHVLACPMMSRHIILACTETTWSTGRNTTSNTTPLSSVCCALCVFMSLYFLKRHFQLDHNVDHQCLSVVEALVTTLKKERVTYCDPGRVLPPKRPDTNMASVSEEVQVITIEESISPREAARRERQRVDLSVRNIWIDDDRYVDFKDL